MNRKFNCTVLRLVYGVITGINTSSTLDHPHVSQFFPTPPVQNISHFRILLLTNADHP